MADPGALREPHRFRARSITVSEGKELVKSKVEAGDLAYSV